MVVMASKGRVVVEDEDTDKQAKEISVQESGSEEENQEENDSSNTDDDSDEWKDEESDEEKIEDSDGEDKDEDSKLNSGWADSVAKILKTNKPKGKKTLVLSKAKKITDVKQKPKPAGFEVATADGEVKPEYVEPDSDEDETKIPRKKKKEIPSLRKKPNILEKDRERTLAKIATKGVVQLFNAVRIQQKDIDKKLQEAGPLEVKRDKVLKSIDKRAFLDVLMGEKSQHVDEDMSKEQKQTKDKEKVSWNVLRDDFMMGAKLKDWDKELEEEDEEQEKELEMETEEMECD